MPEGVSSTLTHETIRPAIDTIADAGRFTIGGDVPNYDELQSLGDYTDSFRQHYSSIENSTAPPIYGRNTSAGGREAVSAEEYRTLQTVSSPNYWLLNDESRAAQGNVLAATTFAELPFVGGRHSAPAEDEGAQVALAEAHATAQARLDLDHDIRMAQVRDNSRSALRPGSIPRSVMTLSDERVSPGAPAGMTAQQMRDARPQPWSQAGIRNRVPEAEPRSDDGQSEARRRGSFLTSMQRGSNGYSNDVHRAPHVEPSRVEAPAEARSPRGLRRMGAAIVRTVRNLVS